MARKKMMEKETFEVVESAPTEVRVLDVTPHYGALKEKTLEKLKDIKKRLEDNKVDLEDYSLGLSSRPIKRPSVSATWDISIPAKHTYKLNKEGVYEYFRRGRDRADLVDIDNPLTDKVRKQVERDVGEALNDIMQIIPEINDKVDPEIIRDIIIKSINEAKTKAVTIGLNKTAKGSVLVFEEVLKKNLNKLAKQDGRGGWTYRDTRLILKILRDSALQSYLNLLTRHARDLRQNLEDVLEEVKERKQYLEEIRKLREEKRRSRKRKTKL